MCEDASRSPLMNQTKYRAKTMETYQVFGTVETEIVKNGPVEAVFEVYPDFMHYSSGIYHHNTSSTAKPLGQHAVKLLGFGVFNYSEGQSVEYWIAANSWNSTWVCYMRCSTIYARLSGYVAFPFYWAPSLSDIYDLKGCGNDNHLLAYEPRNGNHLLIPPLYTIRFRAKMATSESRRAIAGLTRIAQLGRLA